MNQAKAIDDLHDSDQDDKFTDLKKDLRKLRNENKGLQEKIAERDKYLR